MNELSNRVLSYLTNHKNFFKRIRKDLSTSDIDRMDVKLFYLFQNNAQKNSNKKKKKSQTSSDYSKGAAGSASSKEEKMEYSLREVLNLSTAELASKVFTFERKLASKDITKMVEGS